MWFSFYTCILKTVYCVYSLESPHWGDSNEYTQHTSMLKKIEKISLLCLLTWHYYAPSLDPTTPDSNLFSWSQRCLSHWSSIVTVCHKWLNLLLPILSYCGHTICTDRPMTFDCSFDLTHSSLNFMLATFTHFGLPSCGGTMEQVRATEGTLNTTHFNERTFLWTLIKFTIVVFDLSHIHSL